MPTAQFWGGQPGGTDWYRAKTPGAALARAGWDVQQIDHLDVTLDGRVSGDPDVLVLSRVADTYLPDAVRRIVAAGHTTVVYDIDDWFGGLPAYNPASRLPQQHLDVMHATMREADLVTVSTPGLASLYRPYSRRPPVVLPNCLDPDLWGDVDRYRTPHDKIHVGWLAAWKWRGGDVDVLRPWLKGWLQSRPDVQFVALGCPEIGPELGIPVATPAGPDALRPFEHLPAMVATLDVGIAPLQPNDFNYRGKSHIKAMEYAAAGVPCVASPSEAYRRYIRPGVNGYLARNSRQWPQLLDRVIARLPTMRDGARRIAANHFIDDRIHMWVDAYTSARKAHACRT